MRTHTSSLYVYAESMRTQTCSGTLTQNQKKQKKNKKKTKKKQKKNKKQNKKIERKLKMKKLTT